MRPIKEHLAMGRVADPKSRRLRDEGRQVLSRANLHGSRAYDNAPLLLRKVMDQ